METSEIRNGILMELIDKMQGRLADAAYPDEEKKEEVVPTKEDAPEKPEMKDKDPEEDEALMAQLMTEREKA